MIWKFVLALNSILVLLPFAAATAGFCSSNPKSEWKQNLVSSVKITRFIGNPEWNISDPSDITTVQTYTGFPSMVSHVFFVPNVNRTTKVRLVTISSYNRSDHTERHSYSKRFGDGSSNQEVYFDCRNITKSDKKFKFIGPRNHSTNTLGDRDTRPDPPQWCLTCLIFEAPSPSTQVTLGIPVEPSTVKIETFKGNKKFCYFRMNTLNATKDNPLYVYAPSNPSVIQAQVNTTLGAFINVYGKNQKNLGKVKRTFVCGLRLK